MNADLPILSYEEEILKAVKYNQVVIITAETGAGKSTQVPQFLLKTRGQDKVIITQPRRVAATSIAARVAEEMGSEVGGLVGYRISGDRKESDATRLVFCTDGLEVVRELLNNTGPDGILVIDEVHEWNRNIEVLLAWVRLQLSRGANYKLILMSATIDAAALAEYFGGEAATVEVPGRTFPIQERRRGASMVEDTVSLLKEGRNVLVFHYGKEPLNKMVIDLTERGLDAEVFALHGEMTAAEQSPCFQSYPRPKCIVATNVVQTSVTIPDIDAVIDSGVQRRVDYVDEVEGLYMRPVSVSDRLQRKGRAGRTKPGVYVDFCRTRMSARSMYNKPEILSLPLDKIVLQLLVAGVEVEEVKFFHQPSAEQVTDARNTLRSLGCVDAEGRLTQIGAEVAKLPVSVRFGRMLVEAGNRLVLPEVIALVSVMEQGGILKEGMRMADDASSWSDAFMHMAAFKIALNLPPDMLESQGFVSMAVADAKATRERLQFMLKPNMIRYATDPEVEIVCCIYAGFHDRVYTRALTSSSYKDQRGNLRELPDWSVVKGVEQLVGHPWNLQVRSELGPKTNRLITMATRIDPKLFAQFV